MISPEMLVVKVMAGVEVGLATDPAKPLALTTDTVVTVPPEVKFQAVPVQFRLPGARAGIAWLMMPLTRVVTGDRLEPDTSPVRVINCPFAVAVPAL